MQVQFDHTETVAKNIKTFWFKPSLSITYQAGQYTQISLHHQDTDDRGDKRWFTLSSSPTEPLISITTKFSSPGSSFKRNLAQLKPGTKLNLADPMGDFVLPKDESIPLIFVAGGIGITPMRSMIKWLNDNHKNRHIDLIYAVSTQTELAFIPLLKAYCHSITTLSRDQVGEKANLTAPKIINLTKPTPNSLIYLSGPEPMIETLVEQFKSTSIKPDQLVTDYFPGYKPI